jgi:hypothetical protein
MRKWKENMIGGKDDWRKRSLEGMPLQQSLFHKIEFTSKNVCIRYLQQMPRLRAVPTSTFPLLWVPSLLHLPALLAPSLHWGQH